MQRSAPAPAAMDHSGADLQLIDGYLQQLLPAMVNTAQKGPDVPAQSLSSLGLDRAALLTAGLPQHAINGLYRSLAAHAGAFKKLMTGEVHQLRMLLQQQAAQQLSGIIQLLEEPMLAVDGQLLQKRLPAAGGSSGPNSKPANAQPAIAGFQQQQQQVLDVQYNQLSAAAANSSDATNQAFAGAAVAPSADEMVKDYAEAYSSMKATMEIRLRHELQRANFMQNKLQQTEGTLRDVTAQFEAATRRIAEQRDEATGLQDQVSGLQGSLAASHAAHLALKQHHSNSMEAWAAEIKTLELQHRDEVEALKQELSAASKAAAALAESTRQVEALRLLYNEELSRASQLAVELSKATAAADRAGAEEEAWRRQLQKSDSRADNAEGMATAMQVTVKQLEEELQQERQRLKQKHCDAEEYRMNLERSRLTAVQDRAAAYCLVKSMAAKLDTAKATLATCEATLTATEDSLKLREMELEGANAQLQASRSHLKQLMSDLEAEQDKSSSMTTALKDFKEQNSELLAAKDKAEGRTKNLLSQLSKASEASVAMSGRITDMQAQLQDRSTELDQLHDQLMREQSGHAAAKEQAQVLRARVGELLQVEFQLGVLQREHEGAAKKVEHLQEENVTLAAKVAELEFTSTQLQQLQQLHEVQSEQLAHEAAELQTVKGELDSSRREGRASAAQVVLLTDKLSTAEQKNNKLTRELFAATSAGDGAQQHIDGLSEQLEQTQAALEAAEADRQVLAAQRDGWMASFQEAYGKLQEWTAASLAAGGKIAARAGTIQTAVQQLGDQISAGNAALDGLVVAGNSSSGARNSMAGGSRGNGSNSSGSSGSGASAAAAAADAGRRAAVAAAEVMDQLAGLQQLMRVEAGKTQDVFSSALQELQARVQQRHESAQAWWSQALEKSKQKKAARAAARKKKRNLTTLALANATRAASSTVSKTSPALAEVAAAAGEPLHAVPAAGQADAAKRGMMVADENKGSDQPGLEGTQQMLGHRQGIEVSACGGIPTSSEGPCGGCGDPQQQNGLVCNMADAAVEGSANVDTKDADLLITECDVSRDQVHATGKDGQAMLLAGIADHASDAVAAQLAGSNASDEQHLDLPLQAGCLQVQEHGTVCRMQRSESSVLSTQRQPAQNLCDAPGKDVAQQQDFELNCNLQGQQQQQHHPQHNLQQHYQELLQQHVLLQHQHQLLLKHLQAQQTEQGFETPVQEVSTAVSTSLVAAPALHAAHQALQHGLGTAAGNLHFKTNVAPSPLGTCQQRLAHLAADRADNVSETAQLAGQRSGEIAAAPLQQMLKGPTSAAGQSAATSSRSNQVHGAVLTAANSSSDATAATTSAASTAAAHSHQELLPQLTFLSTSGRSAEPCAPATDAALDKESGATAFAQVLQQPLLPAVLQVPSHLQPDLLSGQGETSSASAHHVAFHPAHLSTLRPSPLSTISSAGPSQGLDSPMTPSTAALHWLRHHGDASSSLNSSSLGAGSAPVTPGGPGGSSGFLSGFVSLAVYQEQMQGVANLHGQMGQLAAQLREAHADAEGAQQQLQQERQEAATRTAALHEALGQLHTQLDELRGDHEDLQEAHRALVAKDLMRSGLLKDRYVADLFTRLKEAEWKLQTARKRASTWGFDMMVPLGRTDRGIQTQYAEVWAAEQQQQQQYHHSTDVRKAVMAGLALDPGAGMSASTNTVGSISGAAVVRKAPAFTQHNLGHVSGGGKGSDKCQLDSNVTQAVPGGSSQSGSSSSNGGAVDPAECISSTMLASAQELLRSGSAPPLLSAQALLQRIATFYSRKAAADSAALAAHAVPSGLWGFVINQLALQQHQGTKAVHISPSRKGPNSVSAAQEAAALLAQLLGSLQLHASSLKEVALFERALQDSRTADGVAVSSAVSSPRGSGAAAARASSAGTSGVFKGSWGDVALDTGKLQPLMHLSSTVLLPPGAEELLQQVLTWPGMLALLQWVAEGHFLAGLKEGDLGKLLMDVQAPHIHFLLLETADILGLHPLPKIQVAQSSTPFVRLLMVPLIVKPRSCPAAQLAAADGSGSSTRGQQQQQPPLGDGVWRREVLLLVSSAALQLLKPPELQAAMAAALVPALLEGGSDVAGSDEEPGTWDIKQRQQQQQQQQPGFADLATLSSLLALQPALLLSHLPPAMHAMGGCLEAAMVAADRLVAVSGDRGCLLVSQDVQVALEALLLTSNIGPLTASSTPMAAGQQSNGGSGSGAGINPNGAASSSGTCSGSGDGWVGEWLLRIEQQAYPEADGGGSVAVVRLQDLLPDHEMLACDVEGGSSSSGSSRRVAMPSAVRQLTDAEVVLLRVRELRGWYTSQQYQQVMATAKPLRRVLLPASLRSNCRGTSA